MDTTVTDFEQLRRMRADNPKMRERDLAQQCGVSEAELVAAFCGQSAKRISTDFSVLFPGLEAVGEVLALTRNDSAVHEKVGVYDRYIKGRNASLMLGAHIDMRMFPSAWVHGFAVEKDTGSGVKKSLQFFDGHGEAVHKIHAREATNMEAWDELVARLALEDQTPGLLAEVVPFEQPARPALNKAPQSELRQRWEAMTDPHQFVGILKDLDLHRLNAFHLAGDAYAWTLDRSAVTALLHHAANDGLPIMCFVFNRGCIQIHSGPVTNIVAKGPWINVMDEGFHMHLRTDRIAEVWGVRKPVAEGHVTSVEVFDRDGVQIMQFFGVRGEGKKEREDWRELVEKLPRLQALAAGEALA